MMPCRRAQPSSTASGTTPVVPPLQIGEPVKVPRHQSRFQRPVRLVLDAVPALEVGDDWLDLSLALKSLLGVPLASRLSCVERQEEVSGKSMSNTNLKRHIRIATGDIEHAGGRLPNEAGNVFE